MLLEQDFGVVLTALMASAKCSCSAPCGGSATAARRAAGSRGPIQVVGGDGDAGAVQAAALRPPASTKVRMSGPLSLRTRSTIAVSAHSARQSQFWPWISRPLAEREGRISAPVQPSPGSSSAAFLFGAGLGDHFGARVDHDHVFERHAGAGGDAAHFLQVVRRELLDLAREALDQPAARHGVVAQRDQGLAVHGGALADAVRRLLSIGRPRASGAPIRIRRGTA